MFFAFFLSLLFFLTGQTGVSAEEPPSETERISSKMNRVFDAYGGKEAVGRLHSLHAKGKIEALIMHDHGNYELYFQKDRKLRIETRYERSTEVRILNGDRGYRSSKQNVIEEVYGPRFLSMVYQFKHLNLLFDLAGNVYEIRSAGLPAVNGNSAEIFRLNDKDGAIIEISVDDNTHFITKVTAHFRAEGKQIDLSAEFSDFRKVGESVFPFVITNYAGGVKVARTVMESYSLNPDIPDSFFAPSIIQSL